jgi:tetratricopeptide (TPR) repeat protein
LCVLFAVSAAAQQVHAPSTLPDGNTSLIRTYHTQGAVILLTILGASKLPLDRQSVVKLSNSKTGDTLWQTSTEHGEAWFGNLELAPYDLEVSAVGYLTTHKEVNVQNALNAYRVEIVLERDPNSIEISAPSAAQLPKKARKAILHGVAALKSGNYMEAHKQLDAAAALAPENGDVNFLSGYLAFQEKRLDVAKDYLRRAASIDPHHVQALNLLGRICLQQQDYGMAQAALHQAAAANPQDWTAHSLLAEAYLKQHEFEKARTEALAAIERNKVASVPAQLVLGEALANLGRNEEAIQELQIFLQEAPDNPVAAQVRELISSLQRLAAAPAQDAGAPAKAAGPVVGPDPRLAGAEPRFAVMNWEPPGIDESRPEVAAGVACPTEMVVDMAGQRVKQLADDVARFAAIEDLLHERLDSVGYPILRETRKFNYVVSIAESPPGYLDVNEYRSERSGLADLPDHIASNGFISLAMVFHPVMRDNFQITCEGLGDWHGQSTWLVHFQQRRDRPNRFHSYVVGGTVYPVALKGRAWIKTDKFQVVRMESELMSPSPVIQLLTEHQNVEYGPVLFEKKNEELWLPRSAELYFDFRNRRYFRRHSFDHFMLFSVDAAEKRNEPKASPPSPPPSSD